MATILNDQEIEKLLGSIIVHGEKAFIRPNSYILRIGKSGEYLNTNKKFTIGVDEKTGGIKIPPGHSVGLTSYEDIDFTRETVHKIFPGNDLHALITPTTDLSREGIVAPATQIDAGWNGTLNWTLANTSNKERRYLYKTKVFRMTIIKLSNDEIPLNPYDGDYQKQFGYVKSKRFDAPTGMEDNEWETAFHKGGPEDLLEILSRSGPPWDKLAKSLRIIDDKFEAVTDEYRDIKKSIDALKKEVGTVCSDQKGLSEKMETAVGKVIDRRFPDWQSHWWNNLGKFFVGFLGIAIAVFSTEKIMSSVKQYGLYVGLIMLVAAIIFHFSTRKK